MKAMTTTERRVQEIHARQLPPKRFTLGALRLLMRYTAYHEAGHVVARMFTGLEYSHITEVSIIPAEGTFGRATAEHCAAETMIESYPPSMKQDTGRRLLIIMLAGRGAVARAFGENNREYILNSNPHEWNEAGTDLHSVNRIANIMAGKSSRRILEQATAWTIEMLEIPVVWRETKRLARRLLKDGSMDGEAIMDCCHKTVMLAMTLPEWRRRLHKGARRIKRQ